MKQHSQRGIYKLNGIGHFLISITYIPTVKWTNFPFHPLSAPAVRASLGAFGTSIIPQPKIQDPPLGTPTLWKSRPCACFDLYFCS